MSVEEVKNSGVKVKSTDFGGTLTLNKPNLLSKKVEVCLFFLLLLSKAN